VDLRGAWARCQRDRHLVYGQVSATRVMPTCATMGQAVGTAAAIAHSHGTTTRGVYQHHLRELQCALHDGSDRRLRDENYWCELPLGGWIEPHFPAPTTLGRLRLIGDSQLHRSKRMPCS